MDEIKIPVYYYVDHNKTKVYDVDSMQEEFDKKANKITKNKKHIKNNELHGVK